MESIERTTNAKTYYRTLELWLRGFIMMVVQSGRPAAAAQLGAQIPLSNHVHCVRSYDTVVQSQRINVTDANGTAAYMLDSLRCDNEPTLGPTYEINMRSDGARVVPYYALPSALCCPRSSC